MTLPSIKDLYDVIDFTWPAASTQTHKGWLIREGKGGGKRVSAAVQIEANAQIKDAELAMDTLNQNYIFMIRKGEELLDENLAKQGYDLVDPVVILASPIGLINKQYDGDFHLTPSAVMQSTWLKGGVGPARLDVMKRTKVPKIYVDIDATAVAYAAISNDILMVHAVEVSKSHRRKGLGKKIMSPIADWGSKKGAKYLAVITVIENMPARSLYINMGMEKVGHYHYRIKQ